MFFRRQGCPNRKIAENIQTERLVIHVTLFYGRDRLGAPAMTSQTKHGSSFRFGQRNRRNL